MREEEKEEVFQLAARVLIDEYGLSMRLKKTPRVLTLEGDLDGVLGDWREVLLGGSGGKKGDKAELSIEDALNVYDGKDENDKGDFFDRIMRRDLGEDYDAALKLLNFLGPGGREYTILVRYLPILLVGREDPNDYTRRILLTEEERRYTAEVGAPVGRVWKRLDSSCLVPSGLFT
ncbi:hypothetical protein ACHAW5_000676 [Stephanodiscus triporus]|uniref:Uncharacterized protein n=1 Tax=Stephanodiscus triporus TaxID=2934178 RepID=A0ABD3N3G5_9STRA